MEDMTREEVAAHANRPYRPASRPYRPSEMPDGADWPSREQMNQIERLAREHGDLKVQRVLGEPTMVRVSADNREFVFNADGEDRTHVVLAPRSVRIEIPLDVVRELLGDDAVENALTFQMPIHGYTDTLPFALGTHLRPDFVTAVRHLLDDA